MLDLKMIEKEKSIVIASLKKRNFDPSSIEEILELNKKRKSLVGHVDELRSKVKSLSQEIGQLKRQGEDAKDLMYQVHGIKDDIEKEEIIIKEVEEKQTYLLACLPNILDESVPAGKSEDDNAEIHRWGEPKEFDFEIKDHVDVAENLGMLDFEAAAKVTGARFSFLKADLARLERAISNYMLEYLYQRGFEEIAPPFIVHERSLYGTGQLPKFSEDVFKLEGSDWFLIPTAEVPVTNLKREQVFSRKELNLKYCALTPCFRSEAGSHGRDTRGLIRMHQFTKVEMVVIAHPEESNQLHEEMIVNAQGILEALKLPYRSMLLCSADIGFGARKCIDLEVWLPSQNTYREISSISNCGDFQARRAGIRFKDGSNKPEFAHTLNGSGLAVGRTLVAILENYQNEDGSLTIPQALRPYMNNQTEIIPK